MAKYRIMTRKKFGDHPKYALQKKELFFWTWVWDGGYIHECQTYQGAQDVIDYLNGIDSRWTVAKG